MSRTGYLAEAVERALRAPSVHNTQPWRWRIGQGTVELYADRNRHLVATDPDCRDLVLSCGAALHHLCAALAARRLAVDVLRLPDPDDSAHLATVRVRPGRADPADAALAAAIERRHTDRRRMSHVPPPETTLRSLIAQATRLGARLVPVTDPERREQLVAVLVEAARAQEHAPGYAAELQIWTRRYAAGHDGVPAGNVPPPQVGATGGTPLRRFPRAGLAQPRQGTGHGEAGDAAALLVLTTPGDDPLDRLRAGEATSAVLLAATVAGLATTPLSQALEVSSTRAALAGKVLHVTEHPQIVLRIGNPASTAAELPATPRRDLRSVLIPS